MHILVDLMILGFLLLFTDEILLEFNADIPDPVLKLVYFIRIVLHRLITVFHCDAQEFFINLIDHTGKLYHLILV